jgi:hypothetical protein
VRDPEGETFPFDRVVIKEKNGRKTMTIDEFLAIPLAEKIQYILDRNIEFYDGLMPVDRKTALAHLRRRLRG